MEKKLVNILNEMADYLNIAQLKKLQEVLLENLSENLSEKEEITNKPSFWKRRFIMTNYRRMIKRDMKMHFLRMMGYQNLSFWMEAQMK